MASSSTRLIETWDVLKFAIYREGLGKRDRLIETWDVLKCPCPASCAFFSGLIETWDVLKSAWKLSPRNPNND